MAETALQWLAEFGIASLFALFVTCGLVLVAWLATDDDARPVDVLMAVADCEEIN